MSTASSYRSGARGGAASGLWRERHPLALLAMLLVLLPTLLAPSVAAASAAQAGGFAICSSAGLAGAAHAGDGTGHGDLACCGVLCHQATALAGDADAARGYSRVARHFVHAPAATRALRAFPAASSRSIRAPPVAVA